ncbi:MAG TPA: methylenetetrahydrofolate reductase [NAD(P)H] [Actinomycetes bacterium]|nr:methylenetetrahydrofolate reductase [NAD(P)H] [Actinomycetes bacterium]
MLRMGERSWSLEFFPPKTAQGERQVWQTIRELESWAPTFVSVTYGAGGSTQDRTVRLTEQIASETTLNPVGHLTCVGASRAELRHVIGAYAASGVRNILALRGDPPEGPGAPWRPHPSGLRNADELVALIRSLGDLCVGVAAFPDGHPESPDREADALALARKADAGAEFAITQFFFEVAEYEELVARAARHGCTIPVIPGILPVTNVSQLVRFAELSGTPVPDWVLRQLEPVADDPQAVHEVGVALATELCQQLLDAGAPGLHMYTLNRSAATNEVFVNLGVVPRNRSRAHASEVIST